MPIAGFHSDTAVIVEPLRMTTRTRRIQTVMKNQCAHAAPLRFRRNVRSTDSNWMPSLEAISLSDKDNSLSS